MSDEKTEEERLAEMEANADREAVQDVSRETVADATEEKPKKSRATLYCNTTSNNIFTEMGKVSPGCSVKCSAAQAKAWGLEKCPK